MPNDEDFDQVDDEPQETSTIQQMREQLKDQASRLKEVDALKEQAARATQLEAENAFYKADLGDLNETQRKAVLATAAETSPEGYRKAAEELGWLQPPTPVAPASEFEALDRMASAAGASTGLPDAASYQADLDAAKSEADVIAVLAKHGRPVQPNSLEVTGGWDNGGLPNVRYS